MRYIFRGFMIAIILICSIPTFLLAVSMCVWRWESKALEMYMEDTFDGNLRKYITKDWSL